MTCSLKVDHPYPLLVDNYTCTENSMALKCRRNLSHSLFFHLPSSDYLLKMLYVILLHQQMQHPGAPRSSVHQAPPTSSVASMQEADIANVTLALKTLGSFNFGSENAGGMELKFVAAPLHRATASVLGLYSL